MRNIKVKVDEIILRARANRQKHQLAFEEAVRDYKVIIAKATTKNFDLAHPTIGNEPEGFPLNIKWVSLPHPPKNFLADYDRAIMMLELSVDKEIEMDEHVFSQLVMDEWGWKDQFSTSNAMYKSLV